MPRQTGRALNYAHAKGVIHRDLKPENIMIEEQGGVKLMDFGLAQFLGQTRLTETGFRVGMVPYMSPEQIRGEPLDHRSDLFSLGVVLFELLFSKRPFTPSELLDLPAVQPPIPLPWPDSPGDSRIEGLKGVLSRLLAPRPRDRYATAEEFLAVLDAVWPEKAPSPGECRMVKMVDAVKRLQRDQKEPGMPSAAPALVPSVAMPPLPFSPVKFSGLIERVCAFERRDRFPMFIPNPLNPAAPFFSCALAGALKTTPTTTNATHTANHACFFIALSFREKWK